MSFADIFEAAQKGTVEDVRYFVEQKGVDVNAKNDEGQIPLHCAVFNENYTEMIEFLLDAGAKIDAGGINGYTPLHSAAMFSPEITDFLIKKGANVKARANRGETPLHIAYKVKSADILIKNGAELNARDNSGQTPLHYSTGIIIEEKKYEVLEFLVKQGADVGAKDNSGQTPHKAVYLDGPEIYEYLPLPKEVNDELSQIESVVIEYEEKIKNERYREDYARQREEALIATFNANDPGWLEKFKAEITQIMGSQKIDMSRFNSFELDYPDHPRIKKLASRSAKCCLKLLEIEYATTELLVTPDMIPKLRAHNQEALELSRDFYSDYIIPEENDDVDSEISASTAKEDTVKVQVLEEPMRKISEAEEAKKRNKTIAIVSTIVIAILAVVLFGFNGKDDIVTHEDQPEQSETIIFTDYRDDNTYKAVKIGNQTWMAENLNYKTGRSLCYENSESKCNECGRLYDWATAMKACPSGWRLPSSEEWAALGNAIGAVDKYGFYAHACGRHFDGKFLHYGKLAFFWTATESNSKFAFGTALDVNGANLDIGNLSKEYLRSVRCIQSGF